MDKIKIKIIEELNKRNLSEQKKNIDNKIEIFKNGIENKNVIELFR